MKRFSMLLVLILVTSYITYGDQYRSNATTLTWSTAASWQISTDGGGSWATAATVPGNSETDTVLIRNANTVTINQDVKIAQLTVGEGTTGILQYESATTPVRTLWVTGNVTIANGGAFNNGLSVNNLDQFVLGGDLSVGNASKFAMGTSSSRGIITIFNKSDAGDQTISSTGTPTTFDFLYVKMRRNNSTDRVVGTCTFNIKGGNTGLVLKKGIFELTTGTITMPSSVAGAGALWNNDSTGTFKVTGNAKVNFTSGIAGSSAGQLGNIIINTSDTVTLGYNTTAMGNTKFDNAGSLNIISGTINVNGRFITSGTGVTTISGGSVNIDPQNKGATGVILSGSSNPFEVASTGTLNMSGGTVCVVNPDSASGTGLEVKMSGTLNVTGGTISLGNGVASKSSAADGFEIWFASGKVPYNLTINNPSGTNRHVVMTNHTTYNSEVISNNLTILAGELRTTAPDGKAASITIGGNWINNGTYTPHDSSVTTFNGSAAQSISGSTPTTFGRLAITNTTAPVTISTAATIRTTGSVSVNAILAASATLTNNGATSISGSFQLNDGGWATGNAFTYNSTGVLIFNSTGSYGVAGDAYWPDVNGPRYVTVQNTGGISLNVPRTVNSQIQTSAGITNGNNLTVYGIFKLNSGGYIVGAPTYGSASTLTYNTGGTYGRGDEWKTTDPANLQVSNSTTLNYPNGSLTDARSLSGNVTIDTSSALYMDYGSPSPGVGSLTVGGNLVLNGSLSLGNQVGGDLIVKGNWTRTGSFYPNSRSVAFNGTAIQAITGATGFDYLDINNSTGVSLNSDVTVNNSLFLTSGSLYLGSNNLLLGNATTISGTPSATAMIVPNGSGEIRKSFASTPSSFTFPVGDSVGTANYSPVALTLNSGTLTSAYVGVKLSNAKHVDNSSSSDYLNRYWTLTESGIVSPDYSATFTYDAADVVGTESNVVGGYRNGSTWTNLGAVNSGTHSFSVSNTALFGDYTGLALSSFSTAGYVDVKVIPQGFYNAADYLNSTDTIIVYLAASVTPYDMIDSSTVLLDSLSFIGAATFNTAATGNYYLVVKQRSCVETWSASAIAFTKGSTVSYDFTDAQTKAYGDNLIQVSSDPVRWSIYGGDSNQDGYVDPLDLSMIDQDSFNYLSGYGLVTDINGDHYIDPLDMSIADQNSFNYVGIKRPVAAGKVKVHVRVKQ